MRREAPDRWWPDPSAVWPLARQRASARVQALPLYAALTIALLAGSLALRAFAGSVRAAGFIISQDPLLLPLEIITLIAVLYTGFATVVAITREREQGVLELLFYAPLSYADYVFGRALEGIVVFLPAVLLTLLYAVIVGAMSGMGTGWDVVIAALGALVPATAGVSLGVLVGVVVGRVRLAAVLYTVLMGLMLGVQGGDAALNSTVSSGSTGGALLMLRGPMDAVAAVMSWLSPPGYLAHVFDAVRAGTAAGLVLALLAGAVYAVMLVSASAYLLRARGLQP